MTESKINEDIKQRFFQEIERLITIKEMPSVNQFLKAHEIDSRNFYKTKMKENLKVPALWIYYICMDYSVSSDKIIIGR